MELIYLLDSSDYYSRSINRNDVKALQALTIKHSAQGNRIESSIH